MASLSDAYDMLISLRNKLTCLNSAITPQAVDELEDKIGGTFTMAKTHHYTQGQKYGHLVSAILKGKHRIIIGDTTWTHTTPANRGAYSANALTAGNTAATCKEFVAKHKVKQKSYRDYLSIKEAGKELILYTVSDNAIAPLKKQYIGFGNTTVQAMINHLRLKTAIWTKTTQKHEYKMRGYNTPWDPTTSITAYFVLLDHFQVLLGDRGITTSKADKTMAAGAQMWQSEMFTKDQMVVWENKTTAQQTWAELQTYFTEKWLEQKQYSATTAKQLRFKEAALLVRETAVAKEEGEPQAMLFAMLQNQHTKQIKQMEAANKANMDAVIEHRNALVATAGCLKPTHQLDKENTPPLTKNADPTGDGDRSCSRKPRRKKSFCPNCKMMVIPKPELCYELKVDKAARYPG